MILLQELFTPGFDSWLPLSNASKLFFRLGLNEVTVAILIGLIYYRSYRKTDLFLTFFIFNLVIFLMTYLLNHVQMSLGAAFGLFAIFSMLRYRTEGISAKDMTYLFVAISIGMITAICPGSGGTVLLINSLVILVVQLLEGSWLFRKEVSKMIQYDRIDLIPLSRRADLLLDLQRRTELPVHRVDILDIDFLKDAAQLVIYYHPTTDQSRSLLSKHDTPIRPVASI